ncbi:MAG: nickel-responsive transcriptional regulator NikR [Acidobacteria bacterium]|nr:nickel-responsive transcriptional regulator NikR [Acidobacteriota bacterium]
MKITRFGVSCDVDLLTQFDSLIHVEGYANRSEAVADLMRSHIFHQKLEGDTPIVGVVVMVYDHHQRELSENLLQLQHQQHTKIIATTHIHLDRHECLEVLMIQGAAREVQTLADKLISTRGVKRGQLVLAARRD